MTELTYESSSILPEQIGSHLYVLNYTLVAIILYKRDIWSISDKRKIYTNEPLVTLMIYIIQSNVPNKSAKGDKSDLLKMRTKRIIPLGDRAYYT